MTVSLRDQERRALEAVFHTTPDIRLRTRCQAILMAQRGRRRRHLADALCVNVRTRQRWLRGYPDTRLAGRKSRWRPGRSARMPAALAPESLGGSWPRPAGGGVDRAHWTSAELATQLPGFGAKKGVVQW